jgi:hypothetical protein
MMRRAWLELGARSGRFCGILGTGTQLRRGVKSRTAVVAVVSHGEDRVERTVRISLGSDVTDARVRALVPTLRTGGQRMGGGVS